MPVEASMSQSWTDDIDDDPDLHRAKLPAAAEKINKNVKTLTEYRYNDDGKIEKVVRTYSIERVKVSKTIAARKMWKKFGESESDKPGPNQSTTFVAEEVKMVFTSKGEEIQTIPGDDALSKLKGTKSLVCRVCKGDHWTTRCPYKDTLSELQQQLQQKEATLAAMDGKPGAVGSDGQKAPSAGGLAGKYVPPSLRDGIAKRGESMANSRSDDNATVRVTNLSENVTETDLQELFKPFGSVSRIFLAKDKYTQQPKGFAFITYRRREDAQRAIQKVSGLGYDHLILNVEWAKPTAQPL